MICLYCRHDSTRVTNSRAHRRLPEVWRRRVCNECGAVVTTYERIAGKELPLVQAATETSRFSLPRLFVSIYRELPPSPEAPDTAQALAETVMHKLLAAHYSPLTTGEIARTAYKTLHAFNQTAGLRYGLSHGIVTP